MKTTSFGYMKTFFHSPGKVMEYLEFYREGRLHKHSQVEVFTVLKGRGKLIVDEKSLEIFEGETHKIPPDAFHRMIPDKSCLKILVTYES